ncbi:TnsD family Tn7-like transposition protein [Paucibacter sp. R3-3]|uniref:TnsD family Tn7-like transposition protein n=1 Tax=Roseateles agri TaxID=3098619 RepID=A0ABU5DGF9_9BURK|nr:TnsD family Tn7-like transposition protein [Paucibacter sp. R3-3]MDY0744795.1 TnsD family Tn7-like transposition protein [Paucibacter sp. R3-3]
MKLFRPYPSELVGSMLSRAIRDSGLCVPALMQALTGRPLFSHSFVVARHPGIAAAFGMDVEEFIKRHTSTAYSLAFMPAEQRHRLWASAISAEPRASYMAGIASNLTSTTPNLRFCPSCVEEDLATFGESYWRREHQLPAVGVCHLHGRSLLVSTIAMRARLPAPPPHECDGTDPCCCLPLPVQLEVAMWSHRTLNLELQHEQAWPDWFRERAREASYEFVQGTNSGDRLSRDLKRFYSPGFLQDHGCAVDRQVGLQWPARLLRSCAKGIEPLKHVLMGVFLESGERATAAKRKGFIARGPRRDRSLEDAAAVRRVAAVADRVRKQGGQANLAILMRRAGVHTLWRHSYPRLPQLQAWVAEFKATEEYRRWVKEPKGDMRHVGHGE